MSQAEADRGRQKLARLGVVGVLLIIVFGACLWAYLGQYEFRDAYVASIHDAHGVDPRFPEVVTGPDIFVRWKGDGHSEQKLLWGRSDADRLQELATEFRWVELPDGGALGNSKLELIPRAVRGDAVFDDSDLFIIGDVPLRTTWARITIFHSRATGFSLVEIKR
ncbi:MAG: hypothetical protein JNG89_05205 [Planctomycetaceae bacterium]|nr:hypothetical protein [Planctomycetaceae bacterium]